MIRLVIGRLDYRGVNGPPAITFKDYDGSVRLGGVPDMELKPLTKLVINKILNVLGIQFDISNIKRLSDAFEYCTQCSWFSGYINFVGDALPSNAIVTVPTPIIEPISSIIGLALAFNNPNFEVELYSDLWPQITDALAQARALGLKLTIHTSVLDINRIYVFDEVVRRMVRLPRVDVLTGSTEFTNKVEVVGESYRTPTIQANPIKAEPSLTEPRIDEAVLNAVRALGLELGGVSTLKALSDLIGSDAVVRAVTMGYLVYNPMDLTVRLSAKGLALLRATTEEESQGGEGSG
ncbi:MAG: hypothetical protein RQ842_09750 [Vulcanisaeta sp.]|nr:hypothetical protein [Vulcanisaeta sp.]